MARGKRLLNTGEPRTMGPRLRAVSQSKGAVAAAEQEYQKISSTLEKALKHIRKDARISRGLGRDELRNLVKLEKIVEALPEDHPFFSKNPSAGGISTSKEVKAGLLLHIKKLIEIIKQERGVVGLELEELRAVQQEADKFVKKPWWKFW